MLPTTYKKVIVQQSGRDPHQALRIVETAMTPPSANEVLVRHHYAGINYPDIAMMMGRHSMGAKPPFDFGVEALSEVVAVGARVSGLAVGDIVLTGLPGNGYREYARIAANLALKVPALKADYLGLYNSGTAAKVLVDYVLEIQSGETIFVTGALASIGHYVVQLAKRAGNRVIGTCSNADEAAILRDLGIDYAINRSEESIPEVLAAEFSGKLDIVVEALGGSTFDAILPHVAPRARIVVMETLWEHFRNEHNIHHINLYDDLIKRSVRLIGFNFADYAQGFTIEATKLIDQFERGEIKTVIDPTVFRGLESIPTALDHLMTGAGRGKLLVKLVD